VATDGDRRGEETRARFARERREHPRPRAKE
jgi:hypothetical protein